MQGLTDYGQAGKNGNGFLQLRSDGITVMVYTSNGRTGFSGGGVGRGKRGWPVCWLAAPASRFFFISNL